MKMNRWIRRGVTSQRTRQSELKARKIKTRKKRLHQTKSHRKNSKLIWLRLTKLSSLRLQKKRHTVTLQTNCQHWLLRDKLFQIKVVCQHRHPSHKTRKQDQNMDHLSLQRIASSHMKKRRVMKILSTFQRHQVAKKTTLTFSLSTYSIQTRSI